jgi:hypothetical protein
MYQRDMCMRLMGWDLKTLTGSLLSTTGIEKIMVIFQKFLLVFLHYEYSKWSDSSVWNSLDDRYGIHAILSAVSGWCFGTSHDTS